MTEHSSDKRTSAAAEKESPLAQRLNQVILDVQARDGIPYTNKIISAKARECGFEISDAVINHIRRGRVPNPGYRTIQALAKALDIDIRRLYFDDVADETTPKGSLAVRFRGLDSLNDLGRETFSRIASAILRDMENNSVYTDRTSSIEDD
jgi:hypothetical protein